MTRRRSILFVDDEADVRGVVAACLQARGFDVRTAPGVPQALAQMRERPADAVVTDVMMPDESGFSLCEKLKADPATRAVPVLFFTVLADEAKAVKVGASGFISKPFDEAEMVQALERVLEPSTSQERLQAALAHMRDGESQSALDLFGRVIGDESGTPEASWARYYSGQIHQGYGRGEKARHEYTQLLIADPSFWRAHNRLAELLEQAGETDKAVRCWRRSLELNPNQPDVQQRLAGR